MTVLAIVAVLAGAAVLSAAGSMRHAIRCTERHCRCSVAHRWFAGHPLNGQSVTDAGFFRRGTRPLTSMGRASRFHHLPGWQRRFWRTGGTVAVLIVAVSGVVHPARTLRVLELAAVAAAVLGGWQVWSWLRLREHHREWVEPLHRLLAAEMGVPLAARPSSWLKIPLDRREPLIELPAGYDASPKSQEVAVRTVTRTLGLVGADPEWKLDGARRHLTFKVIEPPPGLVTLDGVPSKGIPGIRDLIESSKPDELVLGLGVAGTPVTVSWSGDSPHVGLSMPSGDGKSTVAELMAAQVLFHGGVCLILDYKLFSHPWALFRMPNVFYAGTTQQIHEALLWLDRETKRRYKIAYDSIDMQGDIHDDVGPPIFVIAEELNATIEELREFWREIDGKGPSPAVKALRKAMFIGRGASVHMLLIAQQLTAKATGGGGEARENCAALLIGGNASANTWKMLAKDVTQPPKAAHRGRHYVVTGGGVQVCQVAYLNKRGRPGPEARQLALAGTVTAFPTDDPDMPAGLAKIPTIISGTVAPAGVSDTNTSSGPNLAVDSHAVTAVAEDIRDVPVGLSAAVKAGIVKRGLSAIRIDRWRAERGELERPFPQVVTHRGQEKLYNPAELAEFDAWRRG